MLSTMLSNSRRSISPAVTRQRRIVVNHQVDGLLCAVEQGLTVEKIMAYEFAFADERDSHIDAQWWSFDNTFPLEGRPLIDETSPSVPKYVSPERVKIFEQWLDDGINITEVYIEGNEGNEGLNASIPIDLTKIRTPSIVNWQKRIPIG